MRPSKAIVDGHYAPDALSLCIDILSLRAVSQLDIYGRHQAPERRRILNGQCVIGNTLALLQIPIPATSVVDQALLPVPYVRATSDSIGFKQTVRH